MGGRAVSLKRRELGSRAPKNAIERLTGNIQNSGLKAQCEGEMARRSEIRRAGCR